MRSVRGHERLRRVRCRVLSSAVESAAKLISGDLASKGIKEPLRKVSKKVPIHGALHDGFEKLYGYTSDDSGIPTISSRSRPPRHRLIASR
jgi:hypothetical protein